MTFSITETQHLRDFPSSSAAIKPERLFKTDAITALVVNVDAGQAIEPCLMSATVLYYVIEGSGSLMVEDEQADLQTGSLALVLAGKTRSISAVEPLRVLAVQIA